MMGIEGEEMTLRELWEELRGWDLLDKEREKGNCECLRFEYLFKWK
jgi:hypothetical protein